MRLINPGSLVLGRPNRNRNEKKQQQQTPLASSILLWLVLSISVSCYTTFCAQECAALHNKSWSASYKICGSHSHAGGLRNGYGCCAVLMVAHTKKYVAGNEWRWRCGKPTRPQKPKTQAKIGTKLIGIF